MDSVKDLLNDQLKGTQRAQGVLCYLFRQVLLWEKMNTKKWQRRLDLYFEKPHNKANPDKGNLNKALKSDDLNWTSFKKAIDFLSPYSAVLDIELTWGDDRVSKYSVIVDPTEDETNLTVNNFPYKHTDVFKGMKAPKSLMTHLFRHIVAEEGIDKDRFAALFTHWAANPANVIGLKPEEIASNVNTLRRSITDDKMSWNVFRRGIKTLGPKREVYTLTLHWTNDPKIEPRVVQAIITDPYFTV
jgi:hypothetical protein